MLRESTLQRTCWEQRNEMKDGDPIVIMSFEGKEILKLSVDGIRYKREKIVLLQWRPKW